MWVLMGLREVSASQAPRFIANYRNLFSLLKELADSNEFHSIPNQHNRSPFGMTGIRQVIGHYKSLFDSRSVILPF